MASGFCCELPFLFDTSVDKNKTKTTCIILKFSILVWNSMHHWIIECSFCIAGNIIRQSALFFVEIPSYIELVVVEQGGGTPNLRLKLSQKHPKRPKCFFFTLIEEKTATTPYYLPENTQEHTLEKYQI